MERSRRQTSDMGLEVKIQNPSTPLPRQWDKYISNPKNKTSLVKFIIKIIVRSFGSSKTLKARRWAIFSNYLVEK